MHSETSSAGTAGVQGVSVAPGQPLTPGPCRFEKVDAQILGVSSDSPEKLAGFAQVGTPAPRGRVMHLSRVLA